MSTIYGEDGYVPLEDGKRMLKTMATLKDMGEMFFTSIERLHGMIVEQNARIRELEEKLDERHQ